MADNSTYTALPEKDILLRQWANIGIEQPDDEILKIYQLEQRIGTLAQEAKEIRSLITRLEICHYSFPENIERVIEAIGKLEPVSDFEDCGSFDEERLQFSQRYFSDLTAWLQGRKSETEEMLGERNHLKEWLVACLAKTLKELAGLRESIPELNDLENNRD
jgi:hypothetical protein